jgi:phosphoribosyl 1,2-cyclic phosphodiesterase
VVNTRGLRCQDTSDEGGAVVLRLSFHGVRGSTPCHGHSIQRYGGNTSCVSLQAPGQVPLLFDLGTGLRYFGEETPLDSPFRGVALVTHFHWDHVQGLPFFPPMLSAGASVDIFGPRQDDGRSVGEVFADIIKPPIFPVTLQQLPASLAFHDLGDDDLVIDGWQVRSRFIPHNGPTLGYRVTLQGRSVAYLSDHQQPFDGSHAISDGARQLAEGVDVLIHDAQYTPAEFVERSHWGHCTAEHALWVAGEVGAKQLVLFHYDPRRTDDDLDVQVDRMRAAGAARGVDVVAASQGMTIEVGASGGLMDLGRAG